MKRGGKQDILFSLDKSTFGTAAHLGNANMSTWEKGMTVPRQLPTNQAIAKQLAFTTTYSLIKQSHKWAQKSQPQILEKSKKQCYSAIFNETERPRNWQNTFSDKNTHSGVWQHWEQNARSETRGNKKYNMFTWHCMLDLGFGLLVKNYDITDFWLRTFGYGLLRTFYGLLVKLRIFG